MFDTLFGLNMPPAARVAIAMVIIVGLIGVAAWVIRRFGARRAPTTRARQPHLAVIDAAIVDGRRRLVLIRRDNAEHLMMTGGPNDVVIETNIVRAAMPREAQASRLPAPDETLTRSVPIGEVPTRPLQPQATRLESAPRPSEKLMRAEPPRQPQPGPVPSPPPQGEPPVDEALARLAGILGRPPQRVTPASKPGASWRELLPQRAFRRDPRGSQSQSMPPSPAPAPIRSPAPPTPENRAERSSASTQSPSTD